MRRRVAGLVLLVGAVLIGGYLVGASDRVVPVEVHYVLGDPPLASRLRVVLTKGDDVVATFATELVSPDVVHKTRLPKGPIKAAIFLGDHPQVTRTFEAARDAVIRLELSREGR